MQVGHWLGDNDPTTWGLDGHQWAHHLIRIYRHQLTRAGFNPDHILPHRQPPRVRQRRLEQLQPGWASDPTGLHDWRWFNGVRWTATIGNDRREAAIPERPSGQIATDRHFTT